MFFFAKITFILWKLLTWHSLTSGGNLIACLINRFSWMLCISTSKRVLCTLFAGRNNFFDHKSFLLLKHVFHRFRTCERKCKHNNTQQLVMEKYKKKCFYSERNNFDQQTACRAPIRRSKYTTLNIFLHKREKPNKL